MANKMNNFKGWRVISTPGGSLNYEFTGQVAGSQSLVSVA